MLLDYGVDGEPVRLFESASIILYLAEKHNRFFFEDARLRAEAMNWIFWQMAGQVDALERSCCFL
jgi:GST-like protein